MTDTITVVEQATEIVTVVEQATEIVTVVEQGPQGPAGTGGE